MQKIERAPHARPAAPGGIALIVKGKKLCGIVTDGDIRRAILKGTDLHTAIETIMVKHPLTIRWTPSAGTMLRELHREIKKRGAAESKFHHVIAVDEKGNVVDVITPLELWRHSEVHVKTAAVVGLGYVGLTLALTLAEFGIHVVGIDVNRKTTASLRKGKPHFFEKGLEALLKKHANRHLIVKERFARNESDIYVLCVGTPVGPDGRPVTSGVADAAREIGRVLKHHDLIILRSTVPIGITRSVVIPMLEKTSGLKAGKDFLIAFAPERTVEGRALEELRSLPQVIGGLNRESFEATAQFFRVFAPTIVAVDTLEEAEAVKLLNNAFRDVSFAFANEIAQLSSAHGISARKVIRAANDGYPRNPIPLPSPGVGGMCLVKDPWLLVASGKRGVKPRLPKLSREINEDMVDFVCSLVDRHARRSGRGKRSKIFILGMAFKGKPETSDMRFSTSVDILQKLQRRYRSIAICDPLADNNELKKLKAKVVSSPKEGFRSANCVLVLTNHPSFSELDIFALASSMQQPGFLFDPWGLYSSEKLMTLDGIQYTTL
jgi:nucleotide sugar dehydrogenase